MEVYLISQVTVAMGVETSIVNHVFDEMRARKQRAK